ncbi:MAG: hypothetical protein KY446_04840 [Proteobacteria bacterium]|nr:hypothetical protein [Pseudomonadota bacterium]
MSALARNDHLKPCITIARDRHAPRLLVTLRGALSGRSVAQSLSQVYLSDPEVTRFDMLFDLTEYEGSVGNDDVEAIVAAYKQSNSDPLHPCRTAFVTPDPYFDDWAVVMSFQFTGREHRAFASFGAAETFLADPIEQRPPFTA